MLLNEIMNQPVDWQYDMSRNDDTLATFSINGIDYAVNIIPMFNDVFSIEFALINSDNKEDRQAITGSGNQFQVFATVADIVKNFTNAQHPKGFVFTAKEPSRARLYKRFVPLFQDAGFTKIFNWLNDKGEQFYMVAKDEKTLEKMKARAQGNKVSKL